MFRGISCILVGNPSVGSVGQHSASAPSDDTTFVRPRNIVPLSPVPGLSLNLGSKYVNSDIHKESVHSGCEECVAIYTAQSGRQCAGMIAKYPDRHTKIVKRWGRSRSLVSWHNRVRRVNSSQENAHSDC